MNIFLVKMLRYSCSIAGFMLLAILFMTHSGQCQNLLSWPESMIFDQSHHRYLISNYQTGDIIQVDSNGIQSYFVQGGNAIQGLEIVGNVVYVGAGHMVRGFDLESGEMVMDVPVPDVSNLNDVTADTSGNLYVSDVFGTKIIKVRISDQTYSVFVDGQGINRPNGIFYDKPHNRILVCSYRANSPIQAISLVDTTVTTLATTNLSNCDGITKDTYGNCYVTSWATNSIYLFDSTFSGPPRAAYRNSCGPADISYDVQHGVLAIPLQPCNSWDLLPVTPSSGPYLGQTPPGSTPVRFPPVALLCDGIWMWHGSPLFSVDGMEMFFAKYVSDKPYGNMEIYLMKTINGEWTLPQRPSFASDSSDNSPVFADDGSRLLFTSNREGVIRIYQVTRMDSSWSDPQLVDMDYQSLPGSLGWFFSMTRDGTIYFEIFESTDQNIYRSRLANGRYSTFEKLPDEINSTYPDLRPYIDPDEQYLIFASNRPGGFGSFDLYVSFTNPGGSWTQAQNLGSWINGTQAEDMASVTRDGKYFFFTTVKSGDLGPNPYWADAYFIEGLRPDTTDSSYADKIAFYSERNGNPEIYTMNTDGSDLQRLTTNSAQDVCPAFSPDGSKIAFVSNRDGDLELYVMKNDGSSQQRLTDTPNDEYHPAWSPDGTRIFYMKEMGGNAAICVMNADGTGDTMLTSGTVRDVRPNVSPDGTKIVFNSTRDGNYEIYFMNMDGSNQQRLTYTTTWEVFPAWSPDGNKIAYALVNYPAQDIQVHVMNADGSEDTTLTSIGEINENPCWSPDGRHIVFQSNRDGNFEVYRMNSDGSSQRRLTTATAWDGWPSWGRTCILGDANSDGNTDISDVTYLINYLFKSGPVPTPVMAGDCNNDEQITLSDVVYLINYLFREGPAPSC